MSIELTLSIIKPDAVRKNLIGAIYQRFEEANLEIIAAKMICISAKQAEEFYFVHRDRPFFNDLVSFISSGPVVVQVLRGESAVIKNRDIMGATDPKQALPGTIRADFASSIDENAVHGSDSLESAKIEINYFFSQTEICERS